MQNKAIYEKLRPKIGKYGYLVTEADDYELPLYYADYLRDISVHLGIPMSTIDKHLHRDNKLRWCNKWVKIEKVVFK